MKKIVVVAPELEPGKGKVNYQNNARESVQRKLGEGKKVIFLHCKHFNFNDNFCLQKTKGADLIINDTKTEITHPDIRVVRFSTLSSVN